MSRLLDNESEASSVRTPDDATRTALKTYDFATLYGEENRSPVKLAAVPETVIQSVPPAGTPITDETRVTLILSRGGTFLEMPDVQGLTLAAEFQPPPPTPVDAPSYSADSPAA